MGKHFILLLFCIFIFASTGFAQQEGKKADSNNNSKSDTSTEKTKNNDEVKAMHHREIVSTTLTELDLYPEKFNEKVVYLAVNYEGVQRVSADVFCIGLSSGRITAYSNDYKYVPPIFGGSGIDFLASGGFVDFLNARKQFSGSVIIGGNVIELQGGSYIVNIFDVLPNIIPQFEGVGITGEPNTSLLARTMFYEQLTNDNGFSEANYSGLIKLKADINIKDIKGRTPLILASRRKSSSTKRIKAFISWGAKVNDIDNEGKTALIYAVIAESEDFVKELLKANADISIKDKTGKTASDYAQELKNNKKDILKLLQK